MPKVFLTKQNCLNELKQIFTSLLKKLKVSASILVMFGKQKSQIVKKRSIPRL